MHQFVSKLELSITDLCNFRCVFCPHSTTFPNRANHMSLDTINVCIDHLLELGRDIPITLAGRGEPTLHPQFEEVVKTLISRHGNVKLFTNGARLSRYKHLIPLFSLVVLDIYDETNNVRSLVDTYSKYPNIQIDDMRIDRAGKYRLSVKAGKIRHKNTMLDVSSRASSVNIEGLTDAYYVRNRKFGDACTRPFTNIFVEWSGNYAICCEDWERTIDFDTVHNISFIEYMSTNANYQNIVSSLLQGKRDKAPCIGCKYNLAFTHLLTESEFIMMIYNKKKSQALRATMDDSSRI